VSWTLRVLPDLLAITRLAADSPVPRWSRRSRWTSITRTANELSVVCAAEAVPAGVRCEKPFRAIAVDGTLDFALTGILASIAEPLAKAKISIFAISTFDTDYVLVRQDKLAAAVLALRSAGFRIANR